LATRSGPRSGRTELSRSNALVLMAIGYFQPITRAELSQFLGREVSRDTIAKLRRDGFIAAGPRSPTPGAPYAYVTTPGFLAQFGFESLRDLPDIEKLEDAGLVGRTSEAAFFAGLSGLAQKDFYTKLLNGFVVDWSPESGKKEDRAEPFAVQVNTAMSL
jgi:hypothetical protein